MPPPIYGPKWEEEGPYCVPRRGPCFLGGDTKGGKVPPPVHGPSGRRKARMRRPVGGFGVSSGDTREEERVSPPVCKPSGEEEGVRIPAP